MKITIPEARLRKMRLWILVPAAGDLIHATFSNCLIDLSELLRAHGIVHRIIYLPGDSLVTRARNNLAHLFLSASTESDTDFCLWLDCDILFDPQSVIQMLALDTDFVTAPYSKKGSHQDRIAEAARLNWPNDRMMAVAGTPNVNWLAHPIRCDEPIPVLEAGTGFWLLKRKVLTQLIDAGSAPEYKRSPEEFGHYGKTGHDFFRVGVWPETKEYLSEDWWFCREWRKLGGTVLCCFWIKTNHIGTCFYPMDMPAISDLLTATGGYINAETRPKDGQVSPKETKNAQTQATRTPGNGHATRGDILRAVAALRDVKADQAAIPGDPGPLGRGGSDGRSPAPVL